MGVIAKSMTTINQHNEWGLGIEFMIDCLIDLSVMIGTDCYDSIFKAMESMGQEDQSRLKYLRDNLVSR